VCKKSLHLIKELWNGRVLLKLIFFRHFLFFKQAAFLAAFSVLTCGCKTVSKKTINGVRGLAVKTTKTTSKAAGQLTVATIKAGGRIMLSAGKSSGTALTKLAKNGEVTFINAATGLVSSIPFIKGLNLKMALNSAKMDPRYKIFEIVRPGGIIKVGWKQLSSLGNAKLNSSDVIRVIEIASN
jgi:hypothetical protein